MKKLIIPFIVFIFVIVIVSVKASTPEEIREIVSQSSTTLLDSNLYTHPDDTSTYSQGDVDMEDYTKVIENEDLILFVDEEAYAIRIKNKKTNYIWSSAPINSDLSRSFTERSRSAFTLSLLDERNRPFDDKNLFDVRRLSKAYVADDVNDIVTFSIDMKDYEIRLKYTIKLNKNTLEFKLNREDIEEYGENRLLNISFFEFLGASHTNQIPGYFFIPSGNGALVRFSENSKIKDVYRARFFNQDLYVQISNDSLGLQYPVYGAVHGINQNGLFVNIKSGAEFAEYNYYPVHKGTKYHYQTTNFYLRESYMQYIEGSNESTKITENDLKDYDIAFDLTILSNEDANYVGMAKTYKEYLVDNEILTDYNEKELSLHLDLLGSDYEEGIFFNKTHHMTTVNDILDINEELSRQNVNSIFYTLRGFNNGGNTKADLYNVTFSNELGNYKDLESLNVRYYYNPIVRYKTKMGAPKNTLITITKNFAGTPLLNGDYYQYYTDIEKVLDEFPNALEKTEEYGGMALDGLSNTFYSNQKYKRNEMLPLYQNILEEPIPMFSPNVIMLNKTSKYLNVPLQHERLRFFSDNVPFLQIVLSGYVPYYSTYLNFSANMNQDVLKIIDYGANPAFLITKEPSHLLTKTLSREYYGSYYGNLNEYIIENYQYINNALKHVISEEIVKREVISGTDDQNKNIKGLVAITYSNGVTIYVNYSQEDYVYNGNTIKNLDYLVIGSRLDE